MPEDTKQKTQSASPNEVDEKNREEDNTYAEDGYMADVEDFLADAESLLSNAADLMPSEEFEEIEEPVWQMQESIQKFLEAEKLEGPQSETWAAFQPHRQQIVDNMRNMNINYYQGKPENIRQEARQHTTESVQQADKFFQAAYQKLMKQKTQPAVLHEVDTKNRKEDNAYVDDGYMVGLLAAAEDLMPSAEFEEIEEPVRQMQGSIQKFQEAEKLEGTQPETWEAFQPHRQQIVENMKNMNVSYQEQAAAEVKQEARQRTAESVQQADGFFQDAYQKLMERDRIMQNEMVAMREQLAMMQKIMSNFSPDAMMKCMMAGADYLREAEDARTTAKREPTKAHRSVYQVARQSVHNVYQNIKEAPHRVREAVKQKAYEEADKGLRRIAGVFDKGIASLTERRNAILNLSPLTNQEVPVQQAEAAKNEQDTVKQNLVNVVSVQQLLNPETRERAVQGLTESALSAGHSAEAIGKAFTDLKLSAINSSSLDAAAAAQKPDKNLDMPLPASVLMDQNPVSKAGLFHFLGSQGVTRTTAVQNCTAWKNTADKYLQGKGLVAEKEESKKR